MVSRWLADKIVMIAFLGGGICIAIFVLGGYKWNELASKDLVSVQGCYFVQSKQIFRIVGKSILSAKDSWDFEARHGKSRDSLELDRPIQISREGNVRAASNTSKVGIDYGPPLKLELWDDGDQPVQAVNAPCKR